MARFYYLFVAIIIALFPYISEAQVFPEILQNEIIFQSVKNQCQKWYNPPPVKNIPLIVDRNRSLALIYISTEIPECKGKYSYYKEYTRTEGKRKTKKKHDSSIKRRKHTIFVSCQSPYPVWTRIVWGNDYKNFHDTLDSHTEPINSSLKHVFVASTVLHLQILTTPFPVLVKCKQNLGDFHFKHESKFEFLLLGQGQIDIKSNSTIVDKTMYWEMGSSLNTRRVCSPMFPITGDEDWLYQAFTPINSRNDNHDSVGGIISIIIIATFAVLFIIGACVLNCRQTIRVDCVRMSSLRRLQREPSGQFIWCDFRKFGAGAGTIESLL